MLVGLIREMDGMSLVSGTRWRCLLAGNWGCTGYTVREATSINLCLTIYRCWLHQDSIAMLLSLVTNMFFV